jgi:hypothetical protein
MIDGRSDVRDYTSDSVINDLKVDSTTSLPVHNNAQNMIMVVKKVEGIRNVNIACQDKGTKGQKHNLKKPKLTTYDMEKQKWNKTKP